MAFDFGSDILVDAMRAADPQRAAEARLQLKNLSQNARTIDTSNIEFGTELAQGLKRTTPKEGPRETLQKFEAVVLSTFVQAMMPKDSTSVFGEGLSGDMWKAQMSEKLGEQLAKSGGIGIADRLLKSYKVSGEAIQPVAGLSDPALAVAENHGIDGASQILQHIERVSLLNTAEEEGSSSVVPKVMKGTI